MGDFARALSIGLDELPLNSVEGIVLQHVDLGEVDAPHGFNGTLFQIATTVDVEIFIRSVLRDERAVVGTTLGQFTLEAELNPAISLLNKKSS